MPNGYGPYYSNRGYQLGLTEKEYQALWQAIQGGQYSITDYGETGAYLFGFSDTPPSGYTKLIPGTTRPLPTTQQYPAISTDYQLGVQRMQERQRAIEAGKVTPAYAQFLSTAQTQGMQQKLVASMFPEEMEALYGKAYAGEGFPAQPYQQQKVAGWLAQQPEYLRLLHQWTTATYPSGISGAYGAGGLGASYQAAYLSSLPEGLSPAQREYYQPRATPMYQSFLAKQYPTGTQIPPTEQLMPAFKTYLGEYPWLEKYTAMPQRIKGEYPSRFRPPTRWLNY